MFTPIFLINVHIILEVLTLFIWPLICGWNGVLNDNFVPTFRNKCFQMHVINLVSLSLMINCGIPWCLNHISKNTFVELKVVLITLVGANFPNLENRSITTRWHQFHLSNWVMNSMETHSHDSYRIGRGLYNPYFFVYGFRALAFNTGAHDMFYILFHFGLVESLSYVVLSPRCATMGTQASLAWFLCAISLLTHRFKIVSAGENKLQCKQFYGKLGLHII
jgi:hypothetical protein